MHVAQRFEDTVVDVAPVDERAHQVVVQVADDGLARVRTDDARLDVGVPLPVTTVLQQVGFERREADHGRPALAERPQSRIDSEHEAVRRAFIEKRDDLAREAPEVFLGADALAAVRLSVGGIQEDQVEIRREIELPAAELAHAENHERHDAVVRVAHAAKARSQLAHGPRRRGRQHPVREVRQRGECLVEVGEAEYLAPQHVQQVAVAKAP